MDLFKYFGVAIIALFIVLIYVLDVVAASKHSFKPENGFVPDEITAIRIAEAILVPIYGADKTESEKPFIAVLNKNVWSVKGSLPKNQRLGGVANVEISKKDGQILKVTHGK